MMHLLKSFIIKALRSTGYDLVKYDPTKGEFPHDFTERHINIIKAVRPYTMTTVERIFSLIEATKFIQANKIEGAIVECGVWRGGSMMTVAKTLLELNSSERDLYLFDTYEGMPQPEDKDVSHLGIPAIVTFEETKLPGEDASTWCNASIEDVTNNLYSTNYPKEKLHFIKGKVEATIPENAPTAIALLRLDTDWYESTKHEMIHLFPRLVKGGVLIIDDYGHWQGARKAIDEYIKEKELTILLNRIDYTGRIAVKTN